jgi:ribose/xylose/arabinose/galactoside ABC-type transport system permease subunit
LFLRGLASIGFLLVAVVRDIDLSTDSTFGLRLIIATAWSLYTDLKHIYMLRLCPPCFFPSLQPPLFFSFISGPGTVYDA